jgi:hypothetical protein
VVELDDVVAEPEDVEEEDELEEVVVEDNLVLDKEVVVRMVEEELGEVVVVKKVVEDDAVVKRDVDELDEVETSEPETTELVEGLEPDEPLTNLPKSESGTKKTVTPKANTATRNKQETINRSLPQSIKYIKEKRGI